MRMQIVGSEQIPGQLWFEVFRPGVMDEYGKPECQGRVLLSFEVLPVEECEEYKNSMGREAPNFFPILSEPEGRLTFDIAHPLDFIKQIIGPDLYRQLCLGLFGFLCAILCIVLIPLIVFLVLNNLTSWIS